MPTVCFGFGTTINYISLATTFTDMKYMATYFFPNKENPYLCGDQLLVNCFDITNIYINIFDKDVNHGSAHVKKLYIRNLYKQDAVSVTRLQYICGI